KHKGREVQYVTTQELLEHALMVDMQHWNGATSRRVAAILRLDGWVHGRVEVPDEGTPPTKRQQPKVFLRFESDESDAAPVPQSSDSPHKTLSESDESDESDVLEKTRKTGTEEAVRARYIYKSSRESTSCEFHRKLQEISGTSGSSDSEPLT